MRADAATTQALPGLDARQVRALGASLVTDDLIIFPVRHHSPACALHLLRLFAARTPSAVLVEGPRSFTPLVPLLAHADARAPLAIYTYTVQRGGSESADKSEDRRGAAYYPFSDYSPELVAVREAHRLNVPARFIDLDYSEQFALEARPDEDNASSLLDERHYHRSRYLRALAQQLGCRDHEELWEQLFELSAPSLDLQQHVAQVAVYCHLARQDNTDEELAAEGTLQRESEMAWHIQQALAERTPGSGPVLAVMGGFHAVVMPTLLAKPVKRPKIPRGQVSDESSAVIRYSFDRLDRLNGYCSGMTSPAWHQQLWERTLKHEKAGLPASPRIREEAALTMLFDIAVELREKHQLPLPVPTLAGAYEQALRLAQLRSRPAPSRDDVLDAVTSSFIKGEADADGLLVRAVALRAMSGNTLGKVPPGAGTPPLVRDFEHRARRQRLKIDDSEPRRAVLDIYRRPEHRVTSRLLHGLQLLGVPFATRSAGPDFVNGVGLDRLQEHWEYVYSPVTEGALVEAAVYGVSVPRAMAQRFATRLDQMEADGTARNASLSAKMLTQACVLGLHDHLPRMLAALRAAIGQDADFESVAAAAGGVGLLWESREPLEARDIDELPALLQAAYERTIYLGNELPTPQGDGGKTVQALTQVRELLVSESGRALDADLYWHLVSALQQHHAMPLIRGAAAGLAYCAGRLSEDALGTMLQGHLSGMLPARDAVAFLRGLMQTAREAAWQQPALLGVLDQLLASWDEPAFVAALPELRLAFAEMTPKETDRIAEAVAQLNGVDHIGPLVSRDVDGQQVQAHLTLSQTLREVLAADGLAGFAS